MPGPTQITPPQLARLIGTPDAPTVIDVRIRGDFDAYPHLIPTSIRCLHRDIETLVPDVASNFDAPPFDVEGVFWSHRGGTCTFDTLITECGLSTPALDRLAAVVRAADTDSHDLAPQAAGLLDVSVGLSRMFRDDLQQLEAGMTHYDALYRWARDGFDEGHDWPAGRA